MITIFTHTKPFKGHFGVIQYNAINSWRALSEDVEIMINWSHYLKSIIVKFH